MPDAVGAVLTFAIGVAISPVPIIAVILMLFSSHARVNGPLFLLGWAVALAVVCGAAYALSDTGNVATDSTAVDTVSWGKIVVGALFLLLALRQWRSRPAPEDDMARFDRGGGACHRGGGDRAVGAGRRRFGRAAQGSGRAEGSRFFLSRRGRRREEADPEDLSLA